MFKFIFHLHTCRQKKNGFNGGQGIPMAYFSNLDCDKYFRIKPKAEVSPEAGGSFYLS